MSRNTTAGLSAFLIVAGIVGLTEMHTVFAIAASVFAVGVGLLGARHAIVEL